MSQESGRVHFRKSLYKKAHTAESKTVIAFRGCTHPLPLQGSEEAGFQSAFTQFHAK